MRTLLRLWCVLMGCAALLSYPAAWADAPPPPRTPVIIVGGGLSGMITAYELEKKGIRSTVIEAGDHLGGRIATAEYGHGLQAEYGMQEIWEKSPLVGVVAELGLPTESGNDPWSSFIIDGRLHAFTQDTREAYFRALFTADERAAFERTLAEMESLYKQIDGERLSPDLLKMQAVSWADWLNQRHLPPKVTQALRLTIEVELGSASEDFSALSALEEWRVFLFGGERNYHVTGGNSRIIESLAARTHGPRLLHSEVTAIKRLATGSRPGWEVTYQTGRDIHHLQADAVVVAIPFTRLHAIQFDPPLDAARWKAIKSLGYGQYTVVHFIVSRAIESLWGAPSPFPVLSSGQLGVIYGPHGQGNARDEEVFSLLIYGNEAEAWHMKPREAKVADALAELDHYWPGFSRHVKSTFVYGYHPAAIACWPAGHSPLDAGSRLLRQPMDGGLFLAGDWLYSSHAEGAARSGLDTAKAVARFLGH